MAEPTVRELLEELHGKTDDEVVKGTIDVFKQTDRKVARQDEKLSDFEEKMDRSDAAQKEALDSLKNMLKEGNQVIADRMDSWEKRQIMSSITGLPRNAEKLHEALPEQKRWYAKEMERIVGEKAAPLYACAENWYKCTIKLQARGRYSDADPVKIREERDKIEQALEDVWGKTALVGGTITGGGAMVPSPVAAEVLKQALDSGVFVSAARHIPMTSDTLAIPNLATAVTVYWPDEAGTLTQGEPTFAQKTLTAKKLIGRAIASTELAEDSNVGLISFLVQEFAEQFGRQLDIEGLEGTTSANPAWLGVNGNVPAANIVWANATSTGAADASITYQDVVDVVFAAGENSSRMGAQFFCKPSVYAKTLGLTDSQGMPIVKLGTVEGSPAFSLLGFPVNLQNGLASSTTTGANLYFGPPRSAIYGDRRAMTFGVSEHSKWGTDQLDFKMTGRWGYVVGVPADFAKVGGVDIN